MKFTRRSPTRVDLAGGTLDCWPLFLMTGDCVTVNLSIDVRTQAELELWDQSKISIHLKDLNYQKDFKSLDDVLVSKDPEMLLIQKHLAYWKPMQGFSLTTFSESPVGGGLGGSSSLCISLIHVFKEAFKKDLGLYETVTLASNIEAQILKKPTGTQDYFPALKAGLNAIHYGAQGPRLESLDFDPKFFDQRLILVYTGVPHHSGLNNWQVIKATLDGDTKTMQALQKLRDIAWDVYQVCRENSWDDLAALYQREYEARIQLSSGFSSPKIEQLKQLSVKNGGKAVKICGAGGGGCVFVWADPEQKASLTQKIESEGFRVLSAKAVVD